MFIDTKELQSTRAVDVAGLRVGVCEDDGFFTPSPAIRRAVREAAEALCARGALLFGISDKPDIPSSCAHVSTIVLVVDENTRSGNGRAPRVAACTQM